MLVGGTETKHEILVSGNPSAVQAFIGDNTKILTPPLVPEIKLHLAEESLDIWRKTEEELGEINLPPPFWAFAWVGGQALARYILDNRECVKGARVLDLGSGSGLVGIAAMKAGSESVLACDVDDFAAAAAQINARINNVQIKTATRDFLAQSQSLGEGLRDFDVILVGDLFYERSVALQLMSLIRFASANKKPVFSGDPQRSYFPRAEFVELKSYRVPVTRELEDAEIKKVGVWRFAGQSS